MKKLNETDKLAFLFLMVACGGILLTLLYQDLLMRLIPYSHTGLGVMTLLSIVLSWKTIHLIFKMIDK